MRSPPKLPPGCDPDSILLSFPVVREQAGQRLDRFLQACIPRLSRTRANAIVRNCAYRETGVRRRPSDRVRYGETVIIVRPPMNEPDVSTAFGVLYEDEHILVVDKPAGLPVHPSASYHKKTLTYALRERYGDPAPQIAHRLDRETSGIVVCGRTLEAERVLKRLFEEREMDKRYVAIVHGAMPDDRGRIDLSMGPASEGLHVKMEVREDGLHAVTDYEVLERKAGASWVALFPETGRQHQLRVHLSAIGHPIVGCKLYGPEGDQPFLDYIDEGMTPELEARLGHPRHALHAAGLVLPHPITGETLRLEAPVPDDLTALWARL
ncbi:MAG: RluA family pseudouridine synthase [Polyangiales bacterium]